MAVVSFTIQAVDKTRAVFLSVQQGFKRLNDRTKEFNSTWGAMGRTLATALGVSMQSIADAIAKKYADITSGLTAEEAKMLDDIGELAGQNAGLIREISMGRLDDQGKLNYLIEREAMLRERLKSQSTTSLGDQLEFNRLQVELNRTIADREELQRDLAPDTQKLLEEMRELESKAGKALAPLYGATLSGREQLEALRASVVGLQVELAKIGDKDPADIQKRIDLLGRLIERSEGLVAAEERAKETARELGMTFSSAFEDAIVSGNNLREVLRGLAQDVLRIAVRKSITERLAGGLSDFFGDIFGARAFGGPVSANTPYIVGENGPELFTPSTAGRIIPNHAVSGAAGSGGNTYIIDARGTDESVVQRLAGALQQLAGPGVVERRAVAAVSQYRARGPVFA